MVTKTENPKAPAPDHVCDTNGDLHFPKTDKSFRERRNALEGYKDANLSNQEGTRFEGSAARHNEDDIIRQEGELNRQERDRNRQGAETKPSDNFSAVSGAGEDEKIRFTCSVCGKVQTNSGEVDHVGRDRSGSVSAVECKNAESFNPAPDPQQTDRNVRQMGRLGEMADAQGMNVAYKVPGDHDQAASQIEDSAETIGMPISVVSV